MLCQVLFFLYFSRAVNSFRAPYFVPEGRLVPDTYIVRLRENYGLQQHFEHCGTDLSVLSPEFRTIPLLNSYRVQLDNATVERLIRTDPGVEYIEHDVYFAGQTFTDTAFGNSTIQNAHSDLDLTTTNHSKRWDTEKIADAGWALQMITVAKKLNLDGRDKTIRTLRNPGAGVNAYVLDTGVRITHNAFGGRASNFRSMTRTEYCPPGSVNTDMGDDSTYSHGTAVASLVAGGSMGLGISFANAINVKVCCDCLGQNISMSSSGVALAFMDITEDHEAIVRSAQEGFKGSIINLSFTGPHSLTIEAAIRKAKSSGITVVVPATNDPHLLTSQDFPCNLAETICVASCDFLYQFYDYSAYGDDIDIIAPGKTIKVAIASDNNAIHFLAGNSFASPIVTSVLSNFMGHEGLTNDPKTVRKRMLDNSIRNVITKLPPSTIVGRRRLVKTPNRLISIPTNRDHPRGPPYIGAPY